ncbi:MAG: antibiotic biosynthesis monooxygenase [Prevotellaceae bacterium]|jgi:quinol monooxygenase YgiN|nr:antibiotic biosynthesis monooxygenase [Prevotellaceae bacterium]
MKKYLSLIAIVVMAFSLVSCDCCGHKDKEKSCCSKDAKEAACCKKEKPCCAKDSCSVKIKKVVITAYVEIKSDKVADFLAGAQDVLAKSKAEEGNITYNLFADLKEKNKFVFVEEWKSPAAVDTHFATDHFKAFGAVLEKFAASPAVIKIFEVLNEK